jgi:lon-related putative ATP-dependent protease
LAAGALIRHVDPASLGFLTTAELPDLAELVGQPRATAAIDFALGMGPQAYHLFAMGPSGAGKRTYISSVLQRRAAARSTPPDLCYVYNFDAPERPRLLVVPAGTGAALRADVDHLIEDLRAAIAVALESEEYQARHDAVDREVKAQPERAFQELDERARREGLAIVRTPMGFVVASQRDDHVLTGEDLAALPASERSAIEAKIDAFQNDMQRTLRQAPRWLRTRRERLADLRRETTALAVDHLMDEVRRKYAAVPDAVTYLDAVRHDVTEHAQELLEGERVPDNPAELLAARLGRLRLGSRYSINVVVDNGRTHGAPVIIEDHPTHDSLVGRLEHRAEFGALVTDHSLIRAGALHRAHGGYLLLDARRLLTLPFSWDALKRALQSRHVRIEPPGRALGIVGTVSLEPEPAPLDVQVVLLGDPLLYYLLSVADPDFGNLFKVVADFADDTTATSEDRRRYATLLATLGRAHGLRPFDRHAVARVFEHSARLAGHQERLSLRIGAVLDLMREAAYWAERAGADVVGRPHVQQALDAHLRRADRLRERVHDEIARGTIVVETEGERVGQLNSLSIATLGDFTFGRPVRVTARVRAGQAGVVDIDREVELGGPIHSKGVLILCGYLGEQYASAEPLSLSATLAMEQSYSLVEGDSASAAELCALLSAIAGVPLRQSLAITGSVDQQGRMQAVGAVNEKIEGFFDVCRVRGLTGVHGVIIPAANAQHLMLRPDVVEAAAAGRFSIYAVPTVDAAIELLTGLPAGERDVTGEFPEDTFNRCVAQRLSTLATAWQAFSAPAALVGHGT